MKFGIKKLTPNQLKPSLAMRLPKDAKYKVYLCEDVGGVRQGWINYVPTQKEAFNWIKSVGIANPEMKIRRVAWKLL